MVQQILITITISAKITLKVEEISINENILPKFSKNCMVWLGMRVHFFKSKMPQPHLIQAKVVCSYNGTKWHEMARNGAKWHEMVRNGYGMAPKWLIRIYKFSSHFGF